MKKFKNSLMSLIAIVAMAAFTSCEKAAEYYIALDNVETNMVDAYGNSLAQAYYDAFVFDNGGKTQSLGSTTSEDEAIETFNASCANLKNQFDAAFANLTLPNGWYIAYTLSLHIDSPSGETITTKRIVID